MYTLPAAGLWTVDLTSTTASFEARNFVVNRVPGTIAVRSGAVRTDESGRPSTVTAVLDTASIATGSARRDKDLRAARFFDVAEHPEMRYSGTTVAATDDGGWTVTGTLTVGTHEAPMDLDVSLRRSSVPGTLQVVARGTVDRAAAGIKAPSFVIGRRVDVTIDAVLSLAPAHAEA
jgi:polyisoprenoid-binding protein YceI